MQIRHITRTALLLSSTILATAHAQDGPRPKVRGPGYYGTWPTPAGRKLLDGLAKKTFEDKTFLFGGGTWKITRGAIVPHALGPGRTDIHELHTARTTGPHVVLSQGRCGIFLPTRNDGDVAALLALLGKPGGDTLDAKATSPEWKIAMRRIRGLGVPRGGVRVGLVHEPKSRALSVLIWNIGDEEIDLRGLARLKIDGVNQKVVLRWPPHVKADEDGSRIQLPSGSYYEHKIALPKQAKSTKDTAKRRALFLFRKRTEGKTDGDAVGQLRSPAITWTTPKAESRRAKKPK